MSLHLTAQYAILIFATAEWLLPARPIPLDSAPVGMDRAATPVVQEWTIAGDRILVTNLVGNVTLGAGTGDRFVVRVRLQGKDKDKLQVQVEEGGAAELHVLYPVGEHQRYVYPEMSAGSRTQMGAWRPEARSSALRRMLEAISDRKIEVRGRPWSDAIEAWADVEILVPPSKPAGVKLGVGAIDASAVRASLDLDTSTGAIHATDITGDVILDTGSGSVTARGVRGDALIDTGSGSVQAEDLEGDEVVIDTGSGDVSVQGVKARRVALDTGSGAVNAVRIEAEELVIDTGSGDVTTSEVRASDAEIDTGSGAITLDLAAMGPGQYVIDSGSGRVTVFVPADASARVQASTGSGGIELDVPAARVSRLSRNEVSLEIGKGEAEVVIDTGSGGIRIARRP